MAGDGSVRVSESIGSARENAVTIAALVPVTGEVIYVMEKGSTDMVAAESSSREFFDLIPGSGIAQLMIGVSVAMFVLGFVLREGPLAGMLGTWAISLFVTTLLGMAAFRLWSRSSM